MNESQAEVKRQIIRVFEDISDSGFRLSSWLKSASRIVNSYIIPWIKGIESDNVDTDIFRRLEKTEVKLHVGPSLLRRAHYMFFESPKDLLEIIDILLQSIEPEYRSTHSGSETGNIALVECESMQRIYKYDRRYEGFDILWSPEAVGYLLLDKSGRVCAITEVDEIVSLREFFSGIIIVGNRKVVPIENIKSKLQSSGSKVIVRSSGEQLILMISTQAETNNH